MDKSPTSNSSFSLSNFRIFIDKSTLAQAFMHQMADLQKMDRDIKIGRQLKKSVEKPLKVYSPDLHLVRSVSFQKHANIRWRASWPFRLDYTKFG